MTATAAPMTPNVSKISAGVELSRKTIPVYFDYLHDAKLISLLRSSKKGYSALAKPEKIYLHNTNLAFSLAPQNAHVGALREIFFLNQVRALNKVNYTDRDFLVNDQLLIEVGGRSKKGNNSMVRTYPMWRLME